MEIAFKDEEKYPDAVTSLRIKADAGSLCSVSVVDKSVHLLGGANTLTLQQVRTRVLMLPNYNTNSISSGDRCALIASCASDVLGKRAFTKCCSGNHLACMQLQ